MFDQSRHGHVQERRPGRQAVSQCGHEATPLLVEAVESGGKQVRCLRCGTVGPVREDSEAARRALLARNARNAAGAQGTE
jgi:hypothetical protein